MSTHNTIAIITLVYENYTVLEDFFLSLQAQTHTSFHLYIADASPVPKLLTVPVPASVFRISNKGYSYGINRGLEKATADGISRFVVMNTDVTFQSDFLQHINHSLDHHPSSLIGGKIYYEPGYEYHPKQYSPSQKGTVLWYAGGMIDWAHALTHHRGVDEPDVGQYDKTESTEFVTGCLSIFDNELLKKTGRWDESFFLYYEDADFSVRAAKANCPLMYDPAIRLWHKNAQSTGGSGSQIHEQLQQTSQLRFALKHAPWKTAFHVLKNTGLRLLMKR